MENRCNEAVVKVQKFLLVALLTALAAVGARAQTNVFPSENQPATITAPWTFAVPVILDSTTAPISTVASSVPGGVVAVTNGNSFTDFTIGGGSTVVFCRSNGTIWAPLGAGSGAAPVRFGSYTFYPGTDCAHPSSAGTTYCALNNSTGVVDYSGTDAGVVVNAAMIHVASVCGQLEFKQGTYSFLTLVTIGSGTYSGTAAAVAIPPYVSAGTAYCEWQFSESHRT